MLEQAERTVKLRLGRLKELLLSSRGRAAASGSLLSFPLSQYTPQNLSRVVRRGQFCICEVRPMNNERRRCETVVSGRRAKRRFCSQLSLVLRTRLFCLSALVSLPELT